jgi:hypothetical protein
MEIEITNKIKLAESQVKQVVRDYLQQIIGRDSSVFYEPLFGGIVITSRHDARGNFNGEVGTLASKEQVAAQVIIDSL